MSKNTDLPHNLMAFVCDPVSEQIVLNVIKEKNMAYAEAVQGTPSDALAFVDNNRTPRILILDISNSELPLSDIMKIQEHSTPNLNIIVVGGKNDVGLFRDLMNLGVSDYIVKPLNNNILSTAIDKANGMKISSGKTGKLIQFISAVGGAGATTAAVNIGWLFANNFFKRTLIMDTDFLFGTDNMMLDLKAENAYLDILEAPDKIDDYFVETILRKYSQRLYYLGGLVDLVRGIVVDEATFDALLSIIKKQFNYVLVDSQRTMSPIDRLCFKQADNFVVMVEMTLASAQNAARLLEFLNTDQPGKRVTIIANKLGLSSSGALVRESFEKIVDHEIDFSLPLDETVTLAAANIGQPLTMSEGPLTEPLKDIAEDLLGKHEKKKILNALNQKQGWTADRIKNAVLDFINNLGK